VRTGIRLAARTIAGAHNSEAPAPMKMLLRVISCLARELPLCAVIGPSFGNRGWRRSAMFAVETATSHLRGNHLAAGGRLVKAPAFVEM
jgi:hypothetical protein